MHPDHDTAARLAREWADAWKDPLGDPSYTLRRPEMANGAVLEALLEGYAQRERMREALELYACAGRPQCTAPMLKDGSCVHDLGPGACGDHARAALALTDPSAEARRG